MLSRLFGASQRRLSHFCFLRTATLALQFITGWIRLGGQLCAPIISGR